MNTQLATKSPSKYLAIKALLVLSISAIVASIGSGCGGSGTTNIGSSGSTGTTGTTGSTGSTGGTTSSPASYVYVIQQSSGGVGSILQFAASSNGAVQPTATITPGVAINNLATDATGNIYTYTFSDVREYAAGATGNATPIRLLPAGSTTGIYSVDGLAVSPTGEIVIGQDGGDVDEWSATQNGNVAPTRYIPGESQGNSLSTIVVANQVAVDASDNIYVAPEGQGGAPPIDVFNAAANGKVAATRTIGPTTTSYTGITTDSAGNIYTVGETGCAITSPFACTGIITEYAASASGNATPLRTISGTNTQLGSLCGIQVDAVGTIYVVSTSSSATNPVLLTFSATASGNVAPTTSFTSTAWTTAAHNAFNAQIAIH